MYVQARSAEATPLAEQQIRELLRERHKLRPDQDDDFQVRNLTSGFEAQQESAAVMSLLLASIASVSLFVGGVGIMNIMLVSVTERTKEIGLRQAVGARTRHILSQFLVEAMTLSVSRRLVGDRTGDSRQPDDFASGGLADPGQHQRHCGRVRVFRVRGNLFRLLSG